MLTYEQSGQLMDDGLFRVRVKVACLKYADYVINSRGVAPGGQALLRWAQNAFAAPDGAAQQVTPPLVMDANVQQYGADITDENLQSAVEAAVTKMV